MKRIVLHTADWHLGKNRKHADYLDQQRLMLKTILRITNDMVEKHSDDEVWLIIAGDIFDRNENTGREEFILPIMTILYPLIELKKTRSNFKFFMIDGNHDRQPYDPTDPHSLISVASPLTKMVDDECITVGTPVFFEDESLLLLPFGQYSEQTLIELLQESKAQFAVGHECFYGITTDTGWKPPRDQDHYVNIDNVLKETPDLLALFMGDIHRSQKLDAGGVCWYSGSPVTLDHGHKMPKGILIHEFNNADGVWKRDGEPYLKSLVDYEPTLKVHVQLGVLDKPEDIPFESLAKYPNQYIQLIASPEVHKAIEKELPSLFSSSQVTWEFKAEDKVVKKEAAATTTKEDSIDYYAPLIEQWLAENGKKLTQEEKDKVQAIILNDFSLRN